jgi:peroxiredoxin
MPSSWASAGEAQVTTAQQKHATIAALMKTKLIVGLAAAAMLAAAAAALFIARPAGAPQVTFATLSGEKLATTDLRGKVLLVNFWATSCVVCVKEMPRMVETYKKYAPRGYEMVAVAMSYDHPNQVAEFAQRRALPFKVAVDGSGEIARGFGNIRVTPTSFLIDRQGRIVKRYLGEPDWGEFHALVEKALEDPA